MSKLIILFLVICASMWAMAMNCQSCGDECAPACASGSRYFRTCCFNYLRRKRGSHFKIYDARNKIPQFEDFDNWIQEPVEIYDSLI